MKEYEVVGGVFETPEQGKITLPPEKCTRKDIEHGELVIKTAKTPKDLARAVAMAKENGMTDIPTGRNGKDEGLEM